MVSEQLEPLVSIIIPVYNGGNYMREAIDSALNQTYKNCEILVVNDGSTDHGETERIARSYGNKITYYYKENGGVSSALNYGIRHMKGVYFSWLSHDDIYSKNKIQRQMEMLLRGKDERLIALCETYCIDKGSRRLRAGQKRRAFSENRMIGWFDVLSELLKNGAFYGCAMLIPKKLLEENGYFDESLRFCQDYLMWLLLFINGNKLIYQQEELVALRIHNEQLTQTGRELYHKEMISLTDVVAPKLVEISKKNRNYLYFYAIDAAKYNNPLVIKKCMRIAREERVFSNVDKVKVRLVLFYGKIRPFIRRLYYVLFRNVNTQAV